MKKKRVEAIDVETGKTVYVERLIPENDADRAELARLDREGKIDTRSLSDGPDAP